MNYHKSRHRSVISYRTLKWKKFAPDKDHGIYSREMLGIMVHTCNPAEGGKDEKTLVSGKYSGVS
jgi:hypothetical protein